MLVVSFNPLSGYSSELFIVLGYSALVTFAYVLQRRELGKRDAKIDALMQALSRLLARHPEHFREHAQLIEEDQDQQERRRA